MAEKKKTEYITLEGRAYWCKLYQADEFRGAKRWMLELAMDKEEEWAKYKAAGIQKKIKEDAEKGKFVTLQRNTTKMIGTSLVYFAPPIIYGTDGQPIVHYVNDEGNVVRSYNDESKKINRVGEPVLIGNGSLVRVVLSVYPTAMGPGNRLESVRILDLIHYERPPELLENQEVVGPEVEESEKVKTEKALNDEIPW